MEISTKQLRNYSGRIISQVNDGQEITVTYRGKASAKIVPIVNKKSLNHENLDDELFGIWKDRDDIKNVEQHVRDMRKGRKL
jgi:prevent-host-death family protein